MHLHSMASRTEYGQARGGAESRVSGQPPCRAGAAGRDGYSARPPGWSRRNRYAAAGRPRSLTATAPLAAFGHDRWHYRQALRRRAASVGGAATRSTASGPAWITSSSSEASQRRAPALFSPAWTVRDAVRAGSCRPGRAPCSPLRAGGVRAAPALTWSARRHGNRIPHPRLCRMELALGDGSDTETPPPKRRRETPSSGGRRRIIAPPLPSGWRRRRRQQAPALPAR